MHSFINKSAHQDRPHHLASGPPTGPFSLGLNRIARTSQPSNQATKPPPPQTLTRLASLARDLLPSRRPTRGRCLLRLRWGTKLHQLRRGRSPPKRRLRPCATWRLTPHDAAAAAAATAAAAAAPRPLRRRHAVLTLEAGCRCSGASRRRCRSRRRSRRRCWRCCEERGWSSRCAVSHSCSQRRWRGLQREPHAGEEDGEQGDEHGPRSPGPRRAIAAPGSAPFLLQVRDPRLRPPLPLLVVDAHHRSRGGCRVRWRWKNTGSGSHRISDGRRRR